MNRDSSDVLFVSKVRTPLTNPFDQVHIRFEPYKPIVTLVEVAGMTPKDPALSSLEPLGIRPLDHHGLVFELASQRPFSQESYLRSLPVGDKIS